MDAIAQPPLALPELQLSPAPKIAILGAANLGDLLCATPAYRALRERFPGAEFVLIGKPWAADLIDRSPHLDRLLPFPGWPGLDGETPDPADLGRFLVAARSARFDLALQFRDDGQVSNDLVAALGARLTCGYRCDEGDRRLDWSLPYREDDHTTLRSLKFVARLGARTADRRPVFPITPQEEACAGALLAAHPTRAGRWHRRLVGLHIGAKDPARCWPPARFAALGDLLWGRHGAALVLTGDAADRPFAAEVLRELHSPALSLVGLTDLGTFAAVIARLDLLVTNDTAASHLAAASGTPSAVLFGPSRPEHCAPLDRVRHRAIDVRAHVPSLKDGTRALRRLPAEAVMAICDELLQLRKPQAAASYAIDAAASRLASAILHPSSPDA